MVGDQHRGAGLPGLLRARRSRWSARWPGSPRPPLCGPRARPRRRHGPRRSGCGPGTPAGAGRRPGRSGSCRHAPRRPGARIRAARCSRISAAASPSASTAGSQPEPITSAMSWRSTPVSSRSRSAAAAAWSWGGGVPGSRIDCSGNGAHRHRDVVEHVGQHVDADARHRSGRRRGRPRARTAPSGRSRSSGRRPRCRRGATNPGSAARARLGARPRPGLEHPPAPDRDAVGVGDVVDPAGLEVAADPRGLDVDDAAGAERDRGGRVAGGLDGLVEADRGAHPAGQLGVPTEVVLAQRLLDQQQVEVVEPGEVGARRRGCTPCWRRPGAAMSPYRSRTTRTGSTSQPGSILSLMRR